MKLPPFAQIKLVAVLATASVLLGCEAPTSNAGEQTPDYPIVPASASNLVAVTNLVAEEPAPAQPGSEAPAAAPVALSARLQDVLKLAQSGVGDDVILAFIENSPDPFNPSPDEILYLTDVGLSDVVITALVNHRAAQSETAQQAPPPPAQNEPAAPPAPEQAAPAATYNPEPQVVYSAPPEVQSAPPAPPAEYSYFYNSLSPYGSWVDMPDYGYCWQPTVVVYQHDWRPYCDRGRWLYTDAGLLLAVRLFVGLGAVSLWTLVPSSGTGMVLAAWSDLVARLGVLALYGFSLWLGAVAAWRRTTMPAWALPITERA